MLNQSLIERELMNKISVDNFFKADEIKEWHQNGLRLKEEMLRYDQKYRKKYCMKCPLEKQIYRGCFRVDKFVGGVQETHCQNMIKSRTQKFRKKINAFLESYP